MRKFLVPGVLVAFTLLGMALSGNHPLTASSGTETITAAATLQDAAVSPQKTKSKAQTIAKTPQLSPSRLAINDLNEAAREMRRLCDVCDRSIWTLQQDHTPVGRDQGIIQHVRDVYGDIPRYGAKTLEQKTEELMNTWIMVSKSTTK